jgi:hypothetical protein
LEDASALGALKAAGAAAAAAFERALTGAAFRAMPRVAAGTLRMPLAVLARRRPLATRAAALGIGGTRSIVAALLPMCGPLVVAAPVGAIGTGRLDRGARSSRPGVAMAAFAATSAEPAAAVTATFIARRGRQLERLECLGCGHKAFRQWLDVDLHPRQPLDIAQVETFLRAAESDRAPVRAGTGRTTDAVDILLRNVG